MATAPTPRAAAVTIRTALTAGQIATRVRAFDFFGLSSLLPNPDPILKAAGRDITVYRELSRDAHVGSCIARRKAAVKALSRRVDRAKAAARVTAAIEEMIDALDMGALIEHALDAPLFGYAPMEIDWSRSSTGLRAAKVFELPPEWFCFDSDNGLRFRSREAPLYGEPVPEKKFLLARQGATYFNPYGLPALALCYWASIFGKGGKQFWLSFAEKYGSGFAIGKLPREAQKEEYAQLARDLEALLQNAVAAVPDDSSVEIVEMAGKSASADLYERLVLHCRGEISIALTGTNQSIEKDAGKASAYAGLDVAQHLRDADADVVMAAVQQLIDWTVELNWPGQPAPQYVLWDQRALDKALAERDKANYDSGARFTKSYWMRTYDYQASDLADAPAPLQPGQGEDAATGDPGAAPGAAAGAAAVQQARDAAQPRQRPRLAAAGGVRFAAAGEGTTASGEAVEQLTEQLQDAARPALRAMVQEVAAIVASATDAQQLQQQLVDAYGMLDGGELVKVMEAAFALAELQGMLAVAEQVAAGDDDGDAPPAR